MMYDLPMQLVDVVSTKDGNFFAILQQKHVARMHSYAWLRCNVVVKLEDL